jgi:predicted GIY-YIG superfamily endonuclease
MTKYKFYSINNNKDQMSYIGYTKQKNLNKRMSQHKEDNRRTMANKVLFKKYGSDNCYIDLIEEKKFDTKDEAETYEKKLLKQHKKHLVNKQF